MKSRHARGMCGQLIWGPKIPKTLPYTVLICDTKQEVKWSYERSNDLKNAITLDAKQFPVRFLRHNQRLADGTVFSCQKTLLRV